MAFQCAFLHVVGSPHAQRAWAWGGGGWGWVRGPESWRQGDKAQPEPTQEGHAQQGELCPEGGQARGGQWEPGGVPGEEKETIPEGVAPAHMRASNNCKKASRGTYGLVFIFHC